MPLKEVIRPQVPLRTPCYNLAPLAELRIDTFQKEMRLIRALLGWLDGRCVQDAGTYSPRDYDTRLLGIPISRGRVTDLDPN